MIKLLLVSFLVIVGINILVYFWAFKKQSDHLTDISYSGCFLGMAFYLAMTTENIGVYEIVLLVMIGLWAIRLGGFLFYRIKSIRKDTRFDDFRASWSGFLKFFLLQGISIWVIALPLIIFMNQSPTEGNWYGFIIFIIGWAIESVADWQKFRFKKISPDELFTEGLYSSIRYPNYLGEIMVWVGVFIHCTSALSGWHWLSIISPIWIITLLIYISGIPLVEKARARRYGNDPRYLDYLNTSYKLLPGIY